MALAIRTPIVEVGAQGVEGCFEDPHLQARKAAPFAGREARLDALDARIQLEEFELLAQPVDVHDAALARPQALLEIRRPETPRGLDVDRGQLALDDPDLHHAVLDALVGQFGSGCHVAALDVGQGDPVAQRGEFAEAQAAPAVRGDEILQHRPRQNRIARDADFAHRHRDLAVQIARLALLGHENRGQDRSFRRRGRSKVGKLGQGVAGPHPGQDALGRGGRRQQHQERQGPERGGARGLAYAAV